MLILQIAAGILLANFVVAVVGAFATRRRLAKYAPTMPQQRAPQGPYL